MASNILTKIFGSRNDRLLKTYRKTIERINALETQYEKLDDDQLRTASAPPSELTLLGLMRHAAEVERNWFRRVLAGEQAPPIFGPPDHPEGHDGGFELSSESSYPARVPDLAGRGRPCACQLRGTSAG